MKIAPKFLCMMAEQFARLNVPAADRERLDAAAASGDVARFETELGRIEAIAPKHDAGSDPDAFEVHKRNPHLLAVMKTCQVTAADVRKHGSKTVVVLPNLHDLAASSFRRGDRFGGTE